MAPLTAALGVRYVFDRAAAAPQPVLAAQSGVRAHERRGLPVIRGFRPRKHTSRRGWLARFDGFPENPFTAAQLATPPLRDALVQVLAHADGVRHLGERRIHRADAGEEARS